MRAHRFAAQAAVEEGCWLCEPAVDDEPCAARIALAFDAPHAVRQPRIKARELVEFWLYDGEQVGELEAPRAVEISPKVEDGRL